MALAFPLPTTAPILASVGQQLCERIVFPRATPGLALAALQLTSIMKTNFKAGTMGLYGKFYRDSDVDEFALPSKVGMAIVYGPALLVSMLALKTAWLARESIAMSGNGRELLIAAMLTLHFLKRFLEVVFVHIYSGRMDRGSALGIAAYYALMTKMVVHQQAAVPISITNGKLPVWPLVLFFVGETGNLWHHASLARLRKRSRDAKYVLPSEGLFEFITCPHYLFEILAWVGLALTTAHANAYLLALSMGVYLAGRSDATREWYAQKFGNDGTYLGASVRGRARLFPSDQNLFGSCSLADDI